MLRGGRLVPITLLACVVAVAAASGSPAQRPSARVPVAGIMEHLSAFQRIADRNGGNRFAGTAGYNASARYVAARMRAAGYRVRFQEFAFPFVLDRSPPAVRLVEGATGSFTANRDFRTLMYSGTGRVEARVAAVDLLVPSSGPNASTSGCETSDFDAFPRGAIALLQRGACTFRQKVANALDAGARAVIVFNEGNPGRRELFAATLGPPQVPVPALAASFELGDALRNGVRNGPTGVTVELTTSMIAERRRTRNVIAESRTGSPANLVVAGAHLDSVNAGPGINDNGSGSAVILEVAERLASLRPRNKLRFVWWGAEELGLLGSRHYVQRLSSAARRRHALYLNLDMVGSPNFVLFVYDGDGSSSRSPFALPPGSAAIERLFARYFDTRHIRHRETNIGDSSDHAPFARAGIPIGGLFTGADGRKSSEDARAFGGVAGRPHDACYHQRCDTLANINKTALARSAEAAAYAIRQYARDTSSVSR